jgi:predicted XRE-type DNA-binding protein
MAKPKKLKDRLTAALLEKLRTRKITNAQAAEQLGVSEPYLSRTVAAIQRKEPGKTMLERAKAHKLAETRRKHREGLAKEVKNGNLDVHAAARRAKCSIRTMSRYVAAYVPPRRTRKAA